jgi:hypothetical protein
VIINGRKYLYEVSVIYGILAKVKRCEQIPVKLQNIECYENVLGGNIRAVTDERADRRM